MNVNMNIFLYTACRAIEEWVSLVADIAGTKMKSWVMYIHAIKQRALVCGNSVYGQLAG